MEMVHFIFLNGNKYKGTFKNGKRHGFGTFTLVDGGKYSGEWLNDEISGQGIYEFSQMVMFMRVCLKMEK